MADLPEAAIWHGGIYQLENTDPCLGGADGCDNAAARALGDRTAYLKEHVDSLEAIGVGGVVFFAQSSAPAGYLKTNGALVSRTAYAGLFAAIGTAFGIGDGLTTFALPDLRGEFLRGFDDGKGVDPGRVLGSGQAMDIQAHSHPIIVSNPSSAFGGGDIALSTGNGSADNIGRIVNSGGVETRPRNVALLACIKY